LFVAVYIIILYEQNGERTGTCTEVSFSFEKDGIYRTTYIEVPNRIL
jgi:hypothetical protein